MEKIITPTFLQQIDQSIITLELQLDSIKSSSKIVFLRQLKLCSLEKSIKSLKEVKRVFNLTSDMDKPSTLPKNPLNYRTNN